MRREKLLIWAIIAAFSTGCAPVNRKLPEAITITPTGPIILRPLLTQWEMADQPNLSTGEYSVAIHALRLTGQDTVLLYSITGDGVEKFTESGTTLQMKDDAGNVTSLIAAGMLARLASLEFGYLKFSPRPVSSKELILQVKQGKKPEELIEIPVARLVNPPEDASVYGIRTYLLGTGKVINQDNLRISFMSWAAPSSVPTIITPSVPIPAYPPPGVKGETKGLPTPTPVISGAANQAILKIESDDGETLYLYVQFLIDGEITGELIR